MLVTIPCSLLVTIGLAKGNEFGEHQYVLDTEYMINNVAKTYPDMIDIDNHYQEGAINQVPTHPWWWIGWSLNTGKVIDSTTSLLIFANNDFLFQRAGIKTA